MEKSNNFVPTNKRVQAFRKTLVNPLVEAVTHAETNGFSLFRPFHWTASPNQGQKSRFNRHTRLANKAAMQSRINLLNPRKWAFNDLLPDKEPKLNYTETSFDAIRSG